MFGETECGGEEGSSKKGVELFDLANGLVGFGVIVGESPSLSMMDSWF